MSRVGEHGVSHKLLFAGHFGSECGWVTNRFLGAALSVQGELRYLEWISGVQ